MSMQMIVVAFLLFGAQAAPQLAAPRAQLVQAHGFLTSANTTQHVGTALECGVTSQVTHSTNKYDACPATCPYFASNREDPRSCTFLCVPAKDCQKWNPNKPIADTVVFDSDKRSTSCRGPRVEFCSEMAMDGTDSCVKCQSGFALDVVSGTCHFSYFWTIYLGASIVVAIVTFVLVWFVDFCCRPTVNESEVDKMNRFRERAKILKPKDAANPTEHRHTWPLDTNLCKTDVAGVGMLLHFNFQAFLIGWPLVIAAFWGILACFHNELLVLGTKNFGTPRHNCILVQWGYKTQQELMWTKVLFLVMTYIFSFVSFMMFSVRQYCIYQQYTAEEVTMKNFALELSGLPKLKGRNVEKDIATAVVAATGVPAIVGVSVAWRFDNDDDEDKSAEFFEKCMTACKNDQNDTAASQPTPRTQQERADVDDPTATMGPIRTKMYNIEKALLGPDEEEEEDKQEFTNKLSQMVSSDTAFIVFKTTEDVQKALASTQDGVPFNDPQGGSLKLTLSKVEVEPTTVNWQNFGSSPDAMVRRMVMGFFKTYVPALAVWFFGFYVPYAASLYNFNYENGAELPGYYGLIFTVVVVGGNATMYIVCDICSENIGFRYKDTKQCMYMLMYLFACMFNVLLDMGVTYFTALKVMIGLDFRTVDGTRLADIDAFTDQFETYAMQRSLGGNTFAYAFPSTFLIPFLIEPIVTVLVPYQLGKCIIRTHSEVKGNCAEAYIAAFDFDLGRYADILLNVFLGILIFYFPGGYNLTLFLGMVISHIVIYLFDHWRVLQVIPNIKITSYQVDWWAQVMLAGCCAMILGTLVFKANCEGYAGYCIKDMKLISATFLAGAAHFVLHMCLLIYVVPLFGPNTKDIKSEGKFEDIAKQDAYSWFSVNPVHCLRSKFIHEHKTHCRFVSPGKEHLSQFNPAIGCYFQDEAADTGDFSAPSLSGAMRRLSKQFSKDGTSTEGSGGP